MQQYLDRKRAAEGDAYPILPKSFLAMKAKARAEQEQKWLRAAVSQLSAEVSRCFGVQIEPDGTGAYSLVCRRRNPHVRLSPIFHFVWVNDFPSTGMSSIDAVATTGEGFSRTVVVWRGPRPEHGAPVPEAEHFMRSLSAAKQVHDWKVVLLPSQPSQGSARAWARLGAIESQVRGGRVH